MSLRTTECCGTGPPQEGREGRLCLNTCILPQPKGIFLCPKDLWAIEVVKLLKRVCISMRMLSKDGGFSVWWFICVSMSQAFSRATGGPRGLCMSACLRCSEGQPTGGPRGLCVSGRLRHSVGLPEGLRFPSWEWLLLSSKSHFCSFTYFLLLSSHLKLI